MPEPPIIDAHQHFWDLERNYHPWLCDPQPIGFRYGDYAALRRSYLPDDYARDSAGFEVVATVHMEAEHDPSDPVAETRWVHDLAERCGRPNALVGAAFLERDDAAAVLAAQAGFPLMRGIRHKPAAAPAPEALVPGAPGAMGDPRWRAGYARLAEHGLHFELQCPWWHLGEAAALARDFPDIPIILNHCGLPADRSAAGLQGWGSALRGFAAESNTALKISGLGQPGHEWTVAANGPIVREAIATFGVDRCMFASNYPVDGLCAAFGTIFDGFRAITADLPDADRRKLFHDNAKRYYRPVGVAD